MTKDFSATIRIQQKSKTTVDDRGRTVWNEPVKDVELELVSTTSLEKILQSDDGKTRTEIRKLVKGKKEGVLAKDTATGVFQIVSTEDLQTALEQTDGKPPLSRTADVTAAPLSNKAKQAADELSLCTTQVLRKVLKPGGKTETEKPKIGKKDKFGGFNPYDNN